MFPAIMRFHFRLDVITGSAQIAHPRGKAEYPHVITIKLRKALAFERSQDARVLALHVFPLSIRFEYLRFKQHQQPQPKSRHSATAPLTDGTWRDLHQLRDFNRSAGLVDQFAVFVHEERE